VGREGGGDDDGEFGPRGRLGTFLRIARCSVDGNRLKYIDCEDDGGYSEVG